MCKYILQIGADSCAYPSISDEELSSISGDIPAQEIDRFILKQLHLPEAMLSHIKHREKDNTFRIFFDSLLRWRNMQECRGENAQIILQDLMQQFDKQTLQNSEYIVNKTIYIISRMKVNL